MAEILIITPPFTQLNTPYPATAYLKGFLNSKQVSSIQADLGIEVILHLFSRKGLSDLFTSVEHANTYSENAQRILTLKPFYVDSIDAVIGFLQGNNPSLAWQICNHNYLPQASRFDSDNDLDWAFGNMGMQDKAKHLATLYLEDLSDFISECIDANFGFSRYAERLGRSANSFDELYQELQDPLSYIDPITLDLLQAKVDQHDPAMVSFSVPFPGNLFSAFRCAQYLKQKHPHIKISMGGGFPNTELRSLKDKRVFEFFDYITLDDGERPLELLLKNYKSKQNFASLALKRTYGLENGAVYFNDSSNEKDYKQAELGAPSYTDLPLNKYISVIEMTNPMHSLWSDGRWNKLTMAHGCYWAKCTFCDGSLNYIGHHEAIEAKSLADRVEALITETNERGFHFVDEAAPPSLMKAFAIEVIRRNLSITWWTNIRFEKSFTPDLCYLLKESGCIAVSGGLEVASDRLLKLIKKGVTVEQVAQVCNNLSEAGIMVHSYLMYGFPSQTVQETMDSLEMVRQLFELGIVQSGFWHQFALTAHSPVGKSPKDYKINVHEKEITFAHNDVEFSDKTGIEHQAFSFGLKKSLYNFMHGLGFDIPLHQWFMDEKPPFKLPKTQIPPSYIENCLDSYQAKPIKDQTQIIWLGAEPIYKTISKSKKGRTWQQMELAFHDKEKVLKISLDNKQGEWLLKILSATSIDNDLMTLGDLKNDYEVHFDDFELFWYSKPMQKMKQLGLLHL